jgi:hypothetical protein
MRTLAAAPLMRRFSWSAPTSHISSGAHAPLCLLAWPADVRCYCQLFSNSADTRMLLRRAAIKPDDGADYLINLGESGMQGAQDTWVIGGLCG